MRFLLIVLFLYTNTLLFGQSKKYDYPDTLMVYGNSIDNYGFSPTNPIKVGGGTLPKHVYRYLNSLADSSGVMLKYERIGSCCSKEIGRDKPLTSFRVFSNDNKTESIIYFDQYQWDFPRVITLGYWKETREGYYGEYLNDTIFNGYGIYFFNDGGYYQGYWKNGIMEGQGKMYIPEQETYYGGFVTGKYHGFGKIEYADGGKYQGDWSNGERHGMGKLIYPIGLDILHIEGFFENDNPKGKFKVTYRDGTVDEQEF